MAAEPFAKALVGTPIRRPGEGARTHGAAPEWAAQARPPLVLETHARRYDVVDAVLQRYQAMGREPVCPPHTNVELGALKHDLVLGGRAEWARKQEAADREARANFAKMHARTVRRRPVPGHATPSRTRNPPTPRSGEPELTGTPVDMARPAVKKGGPRANKSLLIVPSRPTQSRAASGGFSGQLGIRVGPAWVTAGMHLAMAGPPSPHRPVRPRTSSGSSRPSPAPAPVDWRNTQTRARSPRAHSPRKEFADELTVESPEPPGPLHPMFDAPRATGRARLAMPLSTSDIHRFGVEENTAWRMRKSWRDAPAGHHVKAMSYVPTSPVVHEPVAPLNVDVLGETQLPRRYENFR